MRKSFVLEFDQLMTKDSRICLLTGDVGYSCLEGLFLKYKKRCLNVGVCEQNMIGVSSGLALEGFFPFVYSISSFLTARATEQIRNDICFQGQPVCLVGNGAGYSYGMMGLSHYALDDVALLKAMPMMQIYLPSDESQMSLIVSNVYNERKPAYIRLAPQLEVICTKPLYENQKTLTRVYTPQSKKVLIGVGHSVQFLLEDPSVESAFLGTIVSISKYPFNLSLDERFVQLIKQADSVFILEEHYYAGSVAESLIPHLYEINSHIKIKTKHPVYKNDQKLGDRKYLLHENHMSQTQLIDWLNQ